jgi:hypothetical protein
MALLAFWEGLSCSDFLSDRIASGWGRTTEDAMPWSFDDLFLVPCLGISEGFLCDLGFSVEADSTEFE